MHIGVSRRMLHIKAYSSLCCTLPCGGAVKSRVVDMPNSHASDPLRKIEKYNAA